MEQEYTNVFREPDGKNACKNTWVDVNIRPKLDSKRNWISERGLDAADLV
jgi:hypothetical protein